MAAITLILGTYALIQRYQNAQLQEEKEEQDTISVSLSTDKPAYRKLEPIIINIVIKNNGSEPVGILKWHTPIEAVEMPCLNVLHRRSLGRSIEVEYLGPLKVIGSDDGVPDANDYYVVPVGESLDMSIDLLLFYDLDLPGSYDVKYNNDLTSFVSNTMQFRVHE